MVIAAIVLVAVVAGVCVHHVRRTEERELYSRLQAVLTPDADFQYNALPLAQQLATARHVLPAVQALQATGWTVSATDLRPLPDDADVSELVYRLGVGDSELMDCTVSDPFSDPAGSCSSFTHRVPAEVKDRAAPGKSAEVSQNVPVELHLGEHSYAASRGRARLSLGAESSFQIEGHVRIEPGDVKISQAALLVPDPEEPKKLEPVELADFSPRTTLQLRTVSAGRWGVSYPMPALLSPFLLWRADADGV